MANQRSRIRKGRLYSCELRHGLYQSTNVLSIALMSICLILITSSGMVASSSFNTRQEQEEYLRQFAYMGSSSPDPQIAALTNADDIFKMAVMKFQMMAGINETGTVDGETIEMMKMPRCGVADEVGMGMVAKRRRRRYTAQGAKWPKTTLTYRINNFTPDLPQATTRDEIKQAFKYWSDESPLNFNEQSSKSAMVDLDIKFASGNHGDGSQNKFDGPGNTLAHAFFPQNGDAHFDEDEKWTTKSNEGVNLLQVAIHEFGHSLGLGHSEVKEAIMAPFYRGYVPNVKLHSDDIEGITYLYGTKADIRPTTPSGPVSTRPPHQSGICADPKVDAVFAVNEDVYVFKGEVYYKLDMQGVVPGFPHQIRDDWQGLPANLDTAVYRPGSPGFIYFFKDDKYWRYDIQKQPNQTNPQDISTGFNGAPNKIDAAFIWSGNGRLYFVKDDQYYRISNRQNRVDRGYPSKLKYWKGLPSKIDAAFNYTNMRTYFFSGSNYYRFNDVKFSIDSGYPKSTADWWLGCTRNRMMEEEYMKGRDQFMISAAGVQLPSARLIPSILILITAVILFRSFA